MNYTSTRDNSRRVTAQEAIVRGISPEGGLFVPEAMPALTGEDLAALQAQGVRAREVLRLDW